MNKPGTIKIDEVEYIRKDSIVEMAVKVDGLDYVIIRASQAGVHAGYLKSKEVNNLREVTLLHARRLWYWDGAASLSQLAMEGVSKPSTCKFPIEVVEITIYHVIEIIKCTEKARLSIKGVPIWSK